MQESDRAQERRQLFLQPDRLRRLRRVLRQQGVALQRSVSQGDLAMQPQVQEREKVRHAASE